MKTLQRTQLIDTLEQTVEWQLREAVGTLQNLSEDTLNRPAADGGWSIAQCLAHLNSYGDYYLPQIGKALDRHPARPDREQFSSTWLGRYFTRMMDPATGKKKYKAFKGHIPSQKLDGHAVVAEFIQQQETLLAYLQRARQADLNDIRIPISLTRWLRLRLGDVLQFLIAHQERHLRQARRNLS